MFGMDRTVVEDILSRLQDEGYLFQQYEFYKEEGKFRLLGKGGFSCVYEVLDKANPEKHYALKVIGFERHSITSEEFQRTTRLQRNLCEQTPYVVRILNTMELRITLDEMGNLLSVIAPEEKSAFDETFLLQFILMEKLENILEKDKFKKAFLNRDEMSSIEEVMCFARQIGEAISVAHKNSVLHRDIKLENIFWDDKEKCYKLGDYGLAKKVEDGSAETIVYTDGYGAPEIERRLNDSYDATADIYSLGITLYLLLNDLKFPGSEGYFVNMVQYAEEFMFPAPKNSVAELTRIIRKMCSYHKEDRYQTVSEVLAELNHIIELAAQTENEVVLVDLATETYREDTNDNKNKEKSEMPSRFRKKQELKAMKSYYSWSSVVYLCVISILFASLLSGIQSENRNVMQWQIMILPIFAIIEALFLRIKEFQVAFGILTVFYFIYSVITSGLYTPQVILILTMLSGISILASAGAIGVALWIGMNWANERSLLAFISEKDIVWILLLLLFIVIKKLILLRICVGKGNEQKEYTVLGFIEILPIILIFAGIIIWIIGRFGVVEIPDELGKLHFIRVGIGAYILNLIDYIRNGKENLEDDVYLDQR